MIGIAVIGLGNALEPHAKSLLDLKDRVRVVWAAARSEARTREAAARFGFPVTSDIARAIADPAVAAVLVLAPPNVHLPLAEAAFAAGKHVLCEKPFAMDLAEARGMLAAAERAGVVHVLGVEFRFATAHELLRRTIAAGAIGTPRQALFAWLVPFLSHPAAQTPDWWEDAARGGGFLGAWGSHLIDQVRVTLGHGCRGSGHHAGSRPSSA